MLPRENFGKLDSRKHHILHSLDRTQLIYTCILLSFSLSLVIHDSRAEVQLRFMILKQRCKILTCFVSMIHDSASTPDAVGRLNCRILYKLWYMYTNTLHLHKFSFMNQPVKILTKQGGGRLGCSWSVTKSVTKHKALKSFRNLFPKMLS